LYLVRVEPGKMKQAVPMLEQRMLQMPQMRTD
jgi:hypothetical protein